MLGVAAGDRMVFQLAEAARKCDMLARRNVLIAQEQHAVLEQGGTDLGKETIVVDRVGEVDADQFGANGVVELFDTHGSLCLR